MSGGPRFSPSPAPRGGRVVTARPPASGHRTAYPPTVLEAIPTEWQVLLRETLADPAMTTLEAFVAREREQFDVYPPAEDVFAALRLTPFAGVRAVVLGQDPYHQPGQATGLAFAVPPDVASPPSLQNILAELGRDLRMPGPATGSLDGWARHGVLLLNAVLTVRRGIANSHAGQGWEHLTTAIVAAVAAKREPVAFLLWGNPAQAYRRYIDEARHVVIASTHPSPLSARRASRGGPAFIASSPFRRANEALTARGQPPIEWDLTAP